MSNISSIGTPSSVPREREIEKPEGNRSLEFRASLEKAHRKRLEDRALSARHVTEQKRLMTYRAIVRTAELYESAEASDRIAERMESLTENMTMTAKFFMSSFYKNRHPEERQEEARQEARQKVIDDLQRLQEALEEQRHRLAPAREADKKDEPPPAHNDQASVGTSNGIEEEIEKLRQKLRDPRNKIEEKNKKAAETPEENLPPSDTDRRLRELDAHAKQLQKIDERLQGIVVRVVHHMTQKMEEDQAPEPQEDTTEGEKKFFDRALDEIRQIREDIDPIRKAHKSSDTRSERTSGKKSDEDIPPPRRDEAERIADRLVKDSSKNQVAKAQELLTPEAVEELLF